MNGEGLEQFNIVTNVTLAMLSVALFLAFLRLLRGPTLPDRVVALDLIAILAVGFVAVYDIATDDAVFLDVAIVLALIAFVSTVAFARYVERGAVQRQNYAHERHVAQESAAQREMEQEETAPGGLHS